VPGVGEGYLAQAGIAGRASALEECSVPGDVVPMLVGEVVIEINRSDGALSHARAAVDAFIGIDEHLDPGELARSLVEGHLAKLIERDGPDDAIARADVDAGGIAGADAFLGDHVCHGPGMSTGRAWFK
jgi:hypothetical protein